MIRAIFFLLLFMPFTLFVIVTGVPITFLDPTGKFLHAYGKIWGRVGLLIAGTKVEVYGAEKIPRDTPLIFMGNHQSNFDILTLYAGLPCHFSWIAKAELFRIPFFGYAMKRAGYLPLDRSDGRQALKMMGSAAEKITERRQCHHLPRRNPFHGRQTHSFQTGRFPAGGSGGSSHSALHH